MRVKEKVFKTRDRPTGILLDVNTKIYLLTYSMEKSPYWEANRFEASQEIPRHFMEPEGTLPHSQVPATCPYPKADQSNPYPISHFLKISSLHLSLFQPGIPTKTLYMPLPFPFRATFPAHLLFSILSPAQYWVRITDHEAPHYEVFSTPLLPRPS
jgi:hypothetical protein